MKKVEAIIRPGKLEDIKEALKDYTKGLTVTAVTGCGLQKGQKEVYRGKEYTLNLIQKYKVEIIAKDSDVEKLIDVLLKVARTGEVGDGKIFIYPVEDAIRIRTGERGENAI